MTCMKTLCLQAIFHMISQSITGIIHLYCSHPAGLAGILQNAQEVLLNRERILAEFCLQISNADVGRGNIEFVELTINGLYFCITNTCLLGPPHTSPIVHRLLP
jgi:hypothetical protein